MYITCSHLDYIGQAKSSDWGNIIAAVMEEGELKTRRQRIYGTMMRCLSDDEQTDLMSWYKNHSKLPPMVISLHNDCTYQIMCAIAYDLGKNV